MSKEKAREYVTKAESYLPKTMVEDEPLGQLGARILDKNLNKYLLANTYAIMALVESNLEDC